MIRKTFSEKRVLVELKQRFAKKIEKRIEIRIAAGIVYVTSANLEYHILKIIQETRPSFNKCSKNGKISLRIALSVMPRVKESVLTQNLLVGFA